MSFNKVQFGYSATEQELAAIRFTVNYCKVYLYGRRNIIKTDHKPLVYLSHMKLVDERLLRMVELESLPGKSNVVVDCLLHAVFPWAIPKDPSKFHRVADNFLEGFEIVSISGAPNSFFAALSYSIYTNFGELNSLREFTLDAVLLNPEKYGFQNNAVDRKLIGSMHDPEVYPTFDLVQAFAEAFKFDVVVYYLPGPLVVVKSATKSPGTE